MPQIHCEVAGDGAPLILLHGIGSNSRSWRRQLNAFSKGFKVIAWDAPGFGRSADPVATVPSIRQYSDDLRELLDSMELSPAVVLGHSLGGIIAQDFYDACPERVRALILSDTTQGGGAEPPEVRLEKLSRRLQMIRTKTPSRLARERAPHLLSKHAPAELVEEATGIMAEVRRPGYEFASIAMSNADTRGVLDNISVPLLMVWGADDEITPVWREFPKRARVEIIQNAGHLCYAEQPESFNSIVLGFLNALE